MRMMDAFHQIVYSRQHCSQCEVRYSNFIPQMLFVAIALELMNCLVFI